MQRCIVGAMPHWTVCKSDEQYHSGDQALRELPSPGKSGSVFFLSHDDRFIIKTMRKVRHICCPEQRCANDPSDPCLDPCCTECHWPSHIRYMPFSSSRPCHEFWAEADCGPFSQQCITRHFKDPLQRHRLLCSFQGTVTTDTICPSLGLSMHPHV